MGCTGARGKGRPHRSLTKHLLGRIPVFMKTYNAAPAPSQLTQELPQIWCSQHSCPNLVVPPVHSTQLHSEASVLFSFYFNCLISPNITSPSKADLCNSVSFIIFFPMAGGLDPRGAEHITIFTIMGSPPCMNCAQSPVYPQNQ